MDTSMKTDIELIDGVEQLSLIQESCEDSYRSWSDHAASVIAASSGNGTIDRRTFEEISRDVYTDELQILARKQRDESETSRITNCF